MSGELERAVTQTCSGIRAYTHWHYTGSEGADIWAGWRLEMCFTSSVSHQPQQTGPLSGQPFTEARDNKLSTLPNFHPSILILLFCLSPSIHFYCRPVFPSCNNWFFSFFIPSLFSCTFLHFHWVLPCFWPVSPISLCLISSVLANGSLGSFPYTTSLFLLASVRANLITLLPHRSLL